MQSTDLEEIKAAIFEQAYHLCTRVSWGMAQVMAARSSKGRLLVQLWERARWYPVERVTIERPLLCPTRACDLEEGPDECSILPERGASWHKVPMGDPRKKSKPGEVLSPRLCYTLSCQAPTCLCLSERGEGKTRLKKCPLERFVAQFFEKRRHRCQTHRPILHPKSCWTGSPMSNRLAGTRTGCGSPTGGPSRSSRSISTATATSPATDLPKSMQRRQITASAG